MTARFRRAYGGSPLELLALLGCFALTGHAALQVSRGPLPVRTAVWFVGAILLHDLVLFPLYALADRSLLALFHRGSRDGVASNAVNYVRLPAMLSGLLLLVFSPVILSRSEEAYRAASGLDQSPYLGRWLAISAGLFLGSAVLYAARSGSRRRATG